MNTEKQPKLSPVVKFLGMVYEHANEAKGHSPPCTSASQSDSSPAKMNVSSRCDAAANRRKAAFSQELDL